MTQDGRPSPDEAARHRGREGFLDRPDDTPAGTYIDKDGTFYYQQAHALYGAPDPRKWTFYTGTDFDTATGPTPSATR